MRVGRRLERGGAQAVVITEDVQLEFGQDGLREPDRLLIILKFF
jgi:hypothetical protein